MIEGAVRDGSLALSLTVLIVVGVIVAAVALLVTAVSFVRVRRAQAHLGRDGTGMSQREINVAASRIRELHEVTLNGLCATAGALIVAGVSAAVESVL